MPHLIQNSLEEVCKLGDEFDQSLTVEKIDVI